MTECVECRAYSCLLRDGSDIRRLILQDKANAIQELVSNAYDGLVLWHSSAEFVEGQQQSGIIPDSNPGTLDDQTSEEWIASLGDARGDLSFATGVFAGDQAYIAGEMIQGSEATECYEFCQEDHRSKCTDARDGDQENSVGAIVPFVTPWLGENACWADAR